MIETDYFIKGIVNGYLKLSPFEVFTEAWMIKKNSATFKNTNNTTAMIPKVSIPGCSPRLKLSKTKSSLLITALKLASLNMAINKVGIAIIAKTKE